ncbi:DUF6308 family protein [Oerskovia flava]|uniref:DUF6308 family protein n=1 Tax=Oerskovia flava TaxID=2986422 RepID=UPI00223EA28F|nr:DUF6308 family protein [Oerskovia sp. JB1-3-2]
MTTSVPSGWPLVSAAIVDAARRTALDALASERLVDYYDTAGDYAGATFASIHPNDPFDVTGADLHAISMLSVQVGPAATRRVLDDGPLRQGLLAALAQTPADVSLADASAADLAAAWDLHCMCRRALADPTTKGPSDPWVTAAKLAARKRPRLLPVRDSKVRRLLGLEPERDGRLELQVLRALVSDPVVRGAIDTAVARARGLAHEAGRACVFDTEPLRVLDAALWLRAIRG